MLDESAPLYDLIVIGSSFGGVMAAYPSVMRGRKVLMIERGDWVERGPHNQGPEGFFSLSAAYSREAPYHVIAGGDSDTLGTIACVGGASVFFGGVALRLREADFEPQPEIDGASGAEWPYKYADLEPFYAQAERILGVAGAGGEDPTEPWRSSSYPQEPAPLAPVSARMMDAARALGLRPFRLPLAINYSTGNGRQSCVACNTCDGFACPFHAKNDLSATIPLLQRAGMRLAVNTVAVRLARAGSRIAHVDCVDRRTLERRRFHGRTFALAAGALATPHLLLASGLERANPAGDAVGRYLMRHCNTILMGYFLRRPAPRNEFHKQVGIHDLYFGHPSITEPAGKLGSIQQFATPQVDYVMRLTEHWIRRNTAGWRSAAARAVAASALPAILRRITGLIVIAEDRPGAENRVALIANTKTRFGMPQASVTHRYDPRDLAARDALVATARRILRRAGAAPIMFPFNIPTFSHAVGTVRLGVDPARAPLDGWGAFRGLENLYVADGSVLPRAGGVNPSLTIAATALRTGTRIAAVS
jgi:choline dehydrogenase-like flavoprotein